MPHFDLQTFEEHYTILQLFDNISLYICLNEPGVNKEKEHPFFKKGISVPHKFGLEKLQLFWNSNNEIIINNNLFKQNTRVKILYKHLLKTEITAKGVQRVFDETPYKKRWVTINDR